MSKITLEILIEDKRWQHIPRLQVRLQKAVTSAFSHLPKTLQIRSTVSVLLTTDAAMRQLNRDFRGLDRPTNVLSFPQFTPRQLTKNGKSRGPISAGDIALGYQYVVCEATKDHKLLINHITHLLIHGLLHIFGYDHGSNTETVRMERLEKKIMAGLGLPDPYAPQPKEPKVH